jgi:NitT/TauT family transport system substrate-binding protein
MRHRALHSAGLKLGAEIPECSRLEFCRQVAVNLKTDADFDKRWCCPRHKVSSFLQLVAIDACAMGIHISFWSKWLKEAITPRGTAIAGFESTGNRAKSEGGDMAQCVLWCLRAVIIALTLIASRAEAADRIRIVALKTGTLAWELETLRAHKLDGNGELVIETTELASTEAGKIALEGGSADLIVSDWLWVGRERALGDNLLFYPYSSALGAVMVPAASPIDSIADLRGKKLGVAGGPLDKSWLLLQAFARRLGVDLRMQAEIVYGAPPLLMQKALRGEIDATLTFWNFCAELEARGMRPVIPIQDVAKGLGASGPVAMVGYVFNGGWAQRNRALLNRFFDATRKVERILTDAPADSAEWQRLAPRIGISDAGALDIYRQRYIQGFARRSLADEAADAQALYRVLVQIGGANLVGPARELDPGTFYSAGARE